MRKKIATLLILAVVMSTAAFAGNFNDNVNKTVITAFNQKFAQAKQVSWSRTDNYVKADFVFNGQYLFAYFSDKGELIGVSRNITTIQLPINLQAQLARQLKNNWVSELVEFSTESDTQYLITLENADQLVSLKSAGSSTWIVLKKTKK